MNDLLAFYEKKRKKTLAVFVLLIILASLTGAGGFACVLLGAIGEAHQGLFVGVGFALFLLVTPALILGALKQKKSFYKSLHEDLAKRLSEGHYEGFSFSYDYDPEMLMKKDIGGIKKSIDPDDASYLEGKKDGIAFFSFAYAYTGNEKGHPEARHGRYYEFTLPSLAKCEARLQNKRSGDLLGKSKLPYAFESESIAFNEAFSYSCADEVKGMEILSPSFLESALLFQEDYPSELNIHWWDSKVVVALHHTPLPVGVSLSTAIDEAYLKGFQKELLLPEKLIALLKA
jgi:hypothetical protein